MKDGNHKMVNLEMTKAEKKREMDYKPDPATAPSYPWGTAMDLEAKLVKKLGLESMDSGDMVHIYAVGKITTIRAVDKGKSDKAVSMTIQFQEMSVESPEDSHKKMRKEIAKQVYDD